MTAASDMMLRSAYCETPAFVFYEVTKNCTSLKYYVIASGARENNLDMTFTIETRNAGIFVRKLDEVSFCKRKLLNVAPGLY